MSFSYFVHSVNTRRDQSRCGARARRCEGRVGGAQNRRRVQCVGEQVCREQSAEARSAEALRKGEARRAEPTWRSVHAEARRAEGRGEILCAKNCRRVQCVGEQVCIERTAEASDAEVLRKGKARRAEPTWHTVHTEARRAEGRGPKGRDEILAVVNIGVPYVRGQGYRERCRGA